MSTSAATPFDAGSTQGYSARAANPKTASAA